MGGSVRTQLALLGRPGEPSSLASADFASRSTI